MYIYIYIVYTSKTHGALNLFPKSLLVTPVYSAHPLPSLPTGTRTPPTEHTENMGRAATNGRFGKCTNHI